MSERRLSVRAPAKVNLSLSVLGTRADGYHEIDTVLLAVSLHDRLAVEERADGELRLALGGPAAAGVPADPSNLALRGAGLVAGLARGRGLAPRGFSLALEKHIPAAAGLGGGSADAAAAAFACARLQGLDPDDPELLEGLQALGSDCAFFLAARASGLARCTGRGERVEPLAPPVLPWSIAVVTPHFGCSTAAVYRALEGPRGTAARPALDPRELARLPLAAARARLANDLEPAALRCHPALGEFRSLLEGCEPGAFRLAGSGSSWFAFFADDASAEAALARVARAAEARRYALRGRWVLRASGRGVEPFDSKLHSRG